MTHAAIYCIAALGAIFNTLPLGTDRWNRILWLKIETIKQINAMIADSERMHSSFSLLAVLYIACCEAWSGDPEVARSVHVPALRRLLRIKGGEGGLMKEVPDFMMLKMRWCGSSLTRVLGTEALFTPSPGVGDVVSIWKRVGGVGELWWQGETQVI